MALVWSNRGSGVGDSGWSPLDAVVVDIASARSAPCLARLGCLRGAGVVAVFFRLRPVLSPSRLTSTSAFLVSFVGSVFLLPYLAGLVGFSFAAGASSFSALGPFFSALPVGAVAFTGAISAGFGCVPCTVRSVERRESGGTEYLGVCAGTALIGMNEGKDSVGRGESGETEGLGFWAGAALTGINGEVIGRGELGGNGG